MTMAHQKEMRGNSEQKEPMREYNNWGTKNYGAMHPPAKIVSNSE